MIRAIITLCHLGTGVALLTSSLASSASASQATSKQSLATAAEPWAIYFPTGVSDVSDGIRFDTDPSDTSANYPLRRRAPLLPDSLNSFAVARRTPYLLRPSNPPGKPMPLKGWMTGGWGYRPPRASHHLGMFTVEGDSCWQEVFPWPWTQTCGAQSARLDSLEEHPCVPCVALYDTSGDCRATFVGARDPAWSPDGTRLAFRTVRNATVFAEGGLREFPESPESVVVF